MMIDKSKLNQSSQTSLDLTQRQTTFLRHLGSRKSTKLSELLENLLLKELAWLQMSKSDSDS